MSVLDRAAAMQDQLLDAMKVGEGAVVSALHTVSERTEPVTGRWAKPPFANRLPAGSDVVGQAFGLAEKVLAHQRDFAVKLVDAVTPAAKATATTSGSRRGPKARTGA